MPQEEQKAPRAAVIMPAYNAASTIEKTVRSILDQTMGDLLLIVVDDGSTDETAAILARLQKEDARLLPITVENGGPARARNLALERVPPGTATDPALSLLPDSGRTARIVRYACAYFVTTLRGRPDRRAISL